MPDNDLFSIIGPALVAGLLVLSTHVPLGREVLKRGIIFIDLAIAQIAALGVVTAGIFMEEAAQPLAFVCALGAAWMFSKTEQKFPKQQEALIGSAFVIASSLALLMLANQPHGGEEIQHMLAGQILWVSWKELGIAALVYLPILWVLLTGRLKPKIFYYIFAITITISVQMVGVYLVFASLILPALAASQIKKRPLVFAYLLAFFGLFMGLIVSTVSDLPTGPVIVMCYAIAAVIGCLCGFQRR